MSGARTASPGRAAWDETPPAERDEVAVFLLAGGMWLAGILLADWGLVWPAATAAMALGWPRSSAAHRFMARFEAIRRRWHDHV